MHVHAASLYHSEPTSLSHPSKPTFLSCPPEPTLPPLPIYTATTSQTDLQVLQHLTELSPDSGNGEELDELDPFKSPPGACQTKREHGIELNKLSVEAAESAPTPANKRGKQETQEHTSSSTRHQERSVGLLSSCGKCNGSGRADLSSGRGASDHNTNMITYVAEKPEVFRLNLQSERAMNNEHERQMTSDLSEGGGQSSYGYGMEHHPAAFNFQSLESSLLASCGPPFQCGPFSTCGTVGRLSNGPFSLSEGEALPGANTSLSPCPLEAADHKASIRPFSIKQEAETVSYCKASPNSCDISYSLSASKIPTLRNPRFCSQGIPARRFTNPEVVRTQPTSGGLLTTTCDLMTSPPGKCACVNPGTSHACAPRLSHRSSLGVLNPLFESQNSTTSVTYTSMPLSPRKYSFDLGLVSKVIDLPDFPKSSMSRVNIPSQNWQHEPAGTTVSLPGSLQDSAIRETSNRTSYNRQIQLPQQPSLENLPFQFQGRALRSPLTTLRASTESLNGNTERSKHQHLGGVESLMLEDGRRTLSDLTAMSGSSLGSSDANIKAPVVTSPDWFSFITPAQDTYTQKLFTPGDLHNELLYPAPYGQTSEVYQNINAREADFVLHRPNRKPRTEPLPPRSTVLLTQKLECDRKPRIIAPIATEDEEALREGARESINARLSERRRSSLEKLFIPKPGDTLESPLNVKIDNFDRDEYVEYKKRFSETDALIIDCLKIASGSASLCENMQPDCEVMAPDSHRLSQISDTKKDASNSPLCDKQSNKVDSGIRSQNNILTHMPSEEYGARRHSQGGTDAAGDSGRSSAQDNDDQHDSHSEGGGIGAGAHTPNHHLPAHHDSVLPSKLPRKQSLPTEELFCSLRARPVIRKLSLISPLPDHLPLDAPCSRAAFVPLREAEEANICLQDKCFSAVQAKASSSSTLKDFIRSLHLGNERPDGGQHVRKNSAETESCSSTPAVKSGLGTSKESTRSGQHVKASRFKEEITGETHLHHHHHQQHHHQHHHHHHHHQQHHTMGSTSHDHSAPQHLQIHTENPASPAHKSKKLKDGSHRSPRRSPKKAQQPAQESHTTLGTFLSPSAQQFAGDLFTNQESGWESRRSSLWSPIVPYQPLVDVTPTSPDAVAPSPDIVATTSPDIVATTSTDIVATTSPDIVATTSPDIVATTSPDGLLTTPQTGATRCDNNSLPSYPKSLSSYPSQVLYSGTGRVLSPDHHLASSHCSGI